MTDHSKDEDPGGCNKRSPWHFFIWRPQPVFSWIFSSRSNDSHYHQISKPDGSNHQSLECESQSCRQHKLVSAHCIDYCRGANIDAQSTPAGEHVRTGRRQNSTSAQSCTVSSSQAGQPWHDVERHAPQGPQNTSASTQISHVYPSSQQDRIDLEKALYNLGNGDVFTSTSQKHHQDLLDRHQDLYDDLISPDGASFAPFAWMAALLQKAILKTSFSERYIGLYPHSADPPIHNKETLPEPPQRHITHREHYQRPLGHKRINFSTPAFTQSLLVYLLQVARAFASFIIALLEPIRISQRSPRDPWFYRLVYRHGHFKTKNPPRKVLEPYICKMEFPQIIDEVDPEWLESFLENSPPFDLNPVYPQELQLAYQLPIPQHDNTYSSDNNYTYFPDNITIEPDHTYVYPLSPFVYSFDTSQPTTSNIFPADTQPASPAEESPMDSSMMPWDDCLIWPASPTPAPVEAETNVRSQSADILPGPATPTMSESVSPQTEGLSTPTFTPMGSSPEVTTPHANPRRTFSCGEESCGRKQFTRRCDLNKHLKTHRKDLKCQYSGCDRSFSTEKDRKRHQQTVHQGEKPFVCDLCDGGKRFSRQDNLKDHRRRIHGVGK